MTKARAEAAIGRQDAAAALRALIKSLARRHARAHHDAEQRRKESDDPGGDLRTL